METIVLEYGNVRLGILMALAQVPAPPPQC
jgi:hypothetical protein